MAVYKPTTGRFEGSGMSGNDMGRIVKPGTPTIVFRDHPNGVHVLICPGYRQDSQGNAVWYKRIVERDNFGLETKKRFPELPEGCPVRYFAGQLQNYYPDYARKYQAATPNSKGYQPWVYPACGRTRAKILFNVLQFNDMGKGPIVMEVPAKNCADAIDAWTSGVRADGTPNPPLNDPDAMIPVLFKLKTGSANPWQVSIDASQIYRIDPNLVDSTRLHNLDDIIDYPDPELLIQQLRDMYPVEVFQKCMSGFSGLPERFKGVSFPNPVLTPTMIPAQRQQPMQAPMQSVNMGTLAMPLQTGGGPRPLYQPAHAGGAAPQNAYAQPVQQVQSQYAPQPGYAQPPIQHAHGPMLTQVPQQQIQQPLQQQPMQQQSVQQVQQMQQAPSYAPQQMAPQPVSNYQQQQPAPLVATGPTHFGADEDSPEGVEVPMRNPMPQPMPVAQQMAYQQQQYAQSQQPTAPPPPQYLQQPAQQLSTQIGGHGVMTPEQIMAAMQNSQ